MSHFCVSYFPRKGNMNFVWLWANLIGLHKKQCVCPALFEGIRSKNTLDWCCDYEKWHYISTIICFTIISVVFIFIKTHWSGNAFICLYILIDHPIHSGYFKSHGNNSIAKNFVEDLTISQINWITSNRFTLLNPTCNIVTDQIKFSACTRRAYCTFIWLLLILCSTCSETAYVTMTVIWICVRY